MSTYLIHNAQGVAVSIGTVVADPLPDGLTAVALSTDDAAKLSSGWGWNPNTLAVDIEPPPPDPDPLDTLTAQVAELQAIIAALVEDTP
jgi:hypothetical protein